MFIFSICENCGWPHASVSLWEVNPLRIYMTLISSSGNPGATVVMSKHMIFERKRYSIGEHTCTYSQICVCKESAHFQWIPGSVWAATWIDLNLPFTHTPTHTHIDVWTVFDTMRSALCSCLTVILAWRDYRLYPNIRAHIRYNFLIHLHSSQFQFSLNGVCAVICEDCISNIEFMVSHLVQYKNVFLILSSSL